MTNPEPVSDELQQKAEWRGRLMADVLSDMHDDKTRQELLYAGLDQAHAEGLLDAAEICQRAADATLHPFTRRTAQVLADGIRKLAKLNKDGRTREAES